MSFVHSLIARPPARYDGNPWTEARLEESANNATFSAVETLTLAGPDADPTRPGRQTLTSAQFSLEEAWIRVVFIDALANESPPSESTFAPESQVVGFGTIAYVQLEELKQTLMMQGESFADDDLLLALDAATTVVNSMCGRSFGPPGGDVVRLYPPRRDDWLEIDDLVAVTSVESSLVGSADFITWNETDYELHPLNAELDNEPWTEIKLPAYSPRLPLRGQRQVRVTGRFGWNDVPDVVRQATGILAARLVKRAREAPFGVTSIGADAVAMRVSRTDPDIENLLAPYMRTLRLA